MSYYNNQGGYAPHGGQASKTKKEKINQWEGIGVIGSKVPNGDIKFYPFPNGGGVIHFNLACTEFTGMSDENGNPKTKTSYIPVSVFANKNITAQQLQAVTIGMKVRVVGKLANQSYEDKKTGQKRSSMAVEAYVFEILESPMQMQYGQPAYGQQPMAPQQYYPQQPYQQMPSQQQYQQPMSQPQIQAPSYAPEKQYNNEQENMTAEETYSLAITDIAQFAIGTNTYDNKLAYWMTQLNLKGYDTSNPDFKKTLEKNVKLCRQGYKQ